jgi:hypothetical protein
MIAPTIAAIRVMPTTVSGVGLVDLAYASRVASRTLDSDGSGSRALMIRMTATRNSR